MLDVCAMHNVSELQPEVRHLMSQWNAKIEGKPISKTTWIQTLHLGSLEGSTARLANLVPTGSTVAMWEEGWIGSWALWCFSVLLCQWCLRVCLSADCLLHASLFISRPVSRALWEVDRLAVFLCAEFILPLSMKISQRLYSSVFASFALPGGRDKEHDSVHIFPRVQLKLKNCLYKFSNNLLFSYSHFP